MTRETKVGLIVASSFLGLVGVVVAARLARHEDSTRPDNIRAAISPVTEKPKSDATKKEPAASEDKKAPGILPIALKSGEAIAEPNSKPTPAFPELVDPGPPPVRPTREKPPALPSSVEITEKEQKAALEALTAEVNKSVPVTNSNNQVAALDPKTPVGTSEPPPLASPKDKTPPTPPPAFSDPAPVAPPKQEMPTTTPASGFSPSPTAPKSADPPSPPPPPVSPVSAPTPAALAGNSGFPPSGTDQKPPTPPPPPAEPKPNASPTGSGFPTDDLKPGPATKPPETTPIPTPPPAATPPTSPPSSADPAPPIGVTPMATSPPITVNPAPATKNPKVVSYDVETYVIKPDDKTFANISQRIYNTDKYAKALAQFNKNYPLAPDALKQDSPLLQAGQQVYFPPIHVLESTYPWAIGESASAPPPPPTSSGNNVGSAPSSPVSVGVPAAITPSPGNPAAVAAPPPGTKVPTAVSTNPDNTRNYTVRDGGEHILEIARTVLRNPQRWAEIYRLNPSVRPEYPIPGGTVLKLPAT